MGASPGGAETGMGAGVANVAVKVAKEVIKRVTEVAKKPGEMATFARRGLSHSKVEGPSAVTKRVVVPQAPKVESTTASVVSHGHEASAQAPVTEAVATEAPTTSKDAAEATELTDEARKMAAAGKEGSRKGSTEVAAPAKTAEKPVGPASRIPQKVAEDENYHRILAQIMKDARDEGETISMQTANERALKTYYLNWGKSMRGRLSIMGERNNPRFKAMINEIRADAKSAKAQGEKYDLGTAIELTIARWKHQEDIREEDNPGEKKDNILILLLKVLLGGVLGGGVAASKEGTESVLNPKG